MADKKISALDPATIPLAGTEVLPIVQSGATVKVSVANLTAGRAISATELTLTTGNLVIGTSGKGIDFSATPNTGTSELFSDYEEGTWTPVFTNCGTGTSITAKYTKVGRLVTINMVFTVTTAVANSSFFSLPIASSQLTAGAFTLNTTQGGFVEVQNGSTCYFATTPSAVLGAFSVSATYPV